MTEVKEEKTEARTLPTAVAPRAKVNRGQTPSDYLCAHSSTASGLYALELLDRLHKAGRLTMDEVREMTAAYDSDSRG